MQRFEASRFANLVSMLGRLHEAGSHVTGPTLRVAEPQKSQIRQRFVDGTTDCQVIGFTQSRLGFLRAFDREDLRTISSLTGASS